MFYLPEWKLIPLHGEGFEFNVGVYGFWKLQWIPESHGAILFMVRNTWIRHSECKPPATRTVRFKGKFFEICLKCYAPSPPLIWGFSV